MNQEQQASAATMLEETEYNNNKRSVYEGNPVEHTVSLRTLYRMECAANRLAEEQAASVAARAAARAAASVAAAPTARGPQSRMLGRSQSIRCCYDPSATNYGSAACEEIVEEEHEQGQADQQGQAEQQVEQQAQAQTKQQEQQQQQVQAEQYNKDIINIVKYHHKKKIF